MKTVDGKDDENNNEPAHGIDINNMLGQERKTDKCILTMPRGFNTSVLIWKTMSLKSPPITSPISI
eukprot:5140619-Heterocapsa_arctica.AAC.1